MTSILDARSFLYQRSRGGRGEKEALQKEGTDLTSVTPECSGGKQATPKLGAGRGGRGVET